MRIEKKIVSFHVDPNRKIQLPKHEVGEKFRIKLVNEEGIEINTIGTIISNNTIDFLSWTAIYDVETEQIDFLGKKIMFESVPERFFEGLKKVS